MMNCMRTVRPTFAFECTLVRRSSTGHVSAQCCVPTQSVHVFRGSNATINNRESIPVVSPSLISPVYATKKLVGNPHRYDATRQNSIAWLEVRLLLTSSHHKSTGHTFPPSCTPISWSKLCPAFCSSQSHLNSPTCNFLV